MMASSADLINGVKMIWIAHHGIFYEYVNLKAKQQKIKFRTPWHRKTSKWSGNIIDPIADERNGKCMTMEEMEKRKVDNPEHPKWYRKRYPNLRIEDRSNFVYKP